MSETTPLSKHDAAIKSALPNVHEAIRTSALMRVLYEKLVDLPAGSFAYLAEFSQLRDVIAPQIGDTRILFPEFTPHDESLHVVQLFQLADKFFGATVFQNLQACELFLLACGLYAHDWGMAVGQAERDYLRAGAPAEATIVGFVPLPNERDQFEAFVRREGLVRNNPLALPMLDDEQIRQYVRQTHARRSGARVRAHFFKLQAEGEAIAQVCEGHWYDFAILDDPQRFPREYQVAGQAAHLLAITLYVRLLDLFHITADRTPFALWEFVSPRDRRSAEEWKKHRALHAVSVEQFPPGRAVKVQGFTEDEEVWAGLEDLRRYCAEQVRGTLEVSARNVPERYFLDFVKVDWAVKTGALRPTNLRFEFDRKAMFQILSDDIYDGDTYVFLRELLQNAIDAIRTRRARHRQRPSTPAKKHVTDPTFETTIYFTVCHQDNGDVVITCRDFGIGMDEHVIRNYFSVAGVSYYRSAEFDCQQLGFEPISRFGIGILSCFMAADGIEVKTYRDPECGPPMSHSDKSLPSNLKFQARRIHLKIPAVDRQFIIKDLAEDFEVGTELRLVARATKIEQIRKERDQKEVVQIDAAQKEFDRKLKVSEFLCEIAGFVEFGIHIEESWPGAQKPRRTLILHPDRNPVEEVKGFEEPVEVHQLSRQYPWESIAEDESISAAKTLMAQRTIEFRDESSGLGYEGWVVFPTPKDEKYDFGSADRSASRLQAEQNHLCLYSKDGNTTSLGVVRWKTPGSYANCPPGIRRKVFGVYRDGILLSEQTAPQLAETDALPLPLIRINLPSSITAPPNVARTSIRKGVEQWQLYLLDSVRKYLLADDIPKALAAPGAERFYQLGWIGYVFRLLPAALSEYVPIEKRLLVSLMPGNGLQIAELDVGSPTEFGLLPSLGRQAAVESIYRQWLGLNVSPSPSIVWDGGAALIADAGQIISHPLAWAFQLHQYWISRYFTRKAIRFVSPPTGIKELLPQLVVAYDGDAEPDRLSSEVVEKGVNGRIAQFRRPHITEALRVAFEDTGNLTPRQLDSLFPYLPMFFHHTQLPGFCSFSSPFDKFFASSLGPVNLSHEFAKAMLRCIAALLIAERDGKLPNQIKRFLPEAQHRFIVGAMQGHPPYSITQFSCDVFDWVVKLKLIPDFKPLAQPTPDEWIPDVLSGASLRQFLEQSWFITTTATYLPVNGTFGVIQTEVPKPRPSSGVMEISRIERHG